MIIVGLSFGYHDSSACILKNGHVVAAIQEERFTRVKNDDSFPRHAIKFCLKEANICAQDVDKWIYYEDTLLKFDRIIKNSFKSLNFKYLHNTIKSWIFSQKFDPKLKISRELDIPKDRIQFVSHHQSHADSAYYCSDFDESTVLTMDGVGEYETMTISIGKKNELKKVNSQVLPHSLGLFYSAFTAFLGFRVNEDEYKVMGMAAYGKPVYTEQLLDFFHFNDDGTFEINQSYFNFSTPSSLPYTNKMLETFGVPRKFDDDFNFEDFDSQNILPEKGTSKFYANLASSVQKCTEEVMIKVSLNAQKLTNIPNLCLSGGVALNGLANSRIRNRIKGDIYINPASGDSGTALGAAKLYYHKNNKKAPLIPLSNVI